MRLGQGHGDLGRRMSRALGDFGGGWLERMMTYQMRPPSICSIAFRRLGSANAVFGPADDGGYWLITLGPRRPADLFAASRWSTEDVPSPKHIASVPQPPASASSAICAMWMH